MKIKKIYSILIVFLVLVIGINAENSGSGSGGGSGQICDCVNDGICADNECKSCPDCVAICQTRQNGVCESWECPDSPDCTGEKGYHDCKSYECFEQNNEWCYNGFLLRNDYCLHCSQDPDCDYSNQPTVASSSSGGGGGGTSTAVAISRPVPVKKCGVNTFKILNECGEGLYRNAYWECYDGYAEKQGSDSSCKTSETWSEYAKKSCEGHCVTYNQPRPISSETESVRIKPAPEPFICSIDAELMKQYDVLIKELKQAEIEDAQEKAEDIKNRINDLREKIAKNKEECYLRNKIEPSEQTVTLITMPMPKEQISRENIASYYKTKTEKIMSQTENVENQIRELKALREDIDNLIKKLLQDKTEIKPSEVSSLVGKIRIKPGEIKADEIQIKTLNKKIMMDINKKPISIEPREKQVIIKDKNFEIKAAEVSVDVDEGSLKVGDIEVKVAPSEVIEKLKVTPTSINLKEENEKAVYEIKIKEKRKLFGFIPITVEKAITADADDGKVIEEHSPWYTFLTSEKKVE